MTVAKWHKVDLHAHTPFDRSRNWGKAANKARDKGFESVESQARDWLDQCAEAGLDIVAVTDHNTLEGFDHIAARIEEWRAETGHRLLVLPGVELSVGGCHFLVVGDPDERNRIERLIGTCLGNRNPFLHSGEPEEAAIGIRDLAHFIQEAADAGGSLLGLPAHVDKSKGLTEELSGLLRERVFAHRAWSGFQVRGKDFKRSKDLLGLWAAASLFGRRPEDLNESQSQQFQAFVARNRARGSWPLVDASDPENLKQLGAVHTWMKMSAPGVEGIRQALLDPESRLRRHQYQPPSPPDTWIQRIEIRGVGVEGASIVSDVLDLELAPSLNALIGGRGTGKSTIIELLRWALGRDRPDDFPRDDSEVGRRVADFLQDAVTGDTRVRLVLRCDDRPVEVVRTRDHHEARWMDADDPATAADVRTLVEPRILSQRQINEIAAGDEAIRREIDHVVGDGLRDLLERRQELVRRLGQMQERRGELTQRLAERAKVETEIERLQGQINAIEHEAASPALPTYRQCQLQERWLTELLQGIDQAAETVPADPLLNEHWPSAPPEGPASELLSDLAERAGEHRSGIEEVRRQFAQRINRLRELVIEAREGAFAELKSPLETDYREAVARLEEQGLELGQLDALHARQADQRRKAEELRELPQRLEELEAQLASVWGELAALHGERRALREQIAESLKEAGADIRLRILPFGDEQEALEQRGRWFGGTGMQQRDWEALVAWVHQGEPSGCETPDPEARARRWRRLVEALRTDSEHLKTASGTADQVRALGSVGLTANLEGALTKVEPDRIDDMERFLPEDHVTALFLDDSGAHRPIRQTSLGQQSTAVLSLLLSVGSGPLILDQPEDDLDNRYIYEVVVELLRDRKRGRQSSRRPTTPTSR
jgi:chorismate mutase